jgi:hypothetical protein
LLKSVLANGEPAASLWMRMMQLSSYTAIIHAVHGGLSSPDGNYLAGFGPLVWLLVIGQAVAGLVIAASIYYTDNVLKCFPLGGALATTVYTWFRVTDSAGALFLAGRILVAVGVWFYCKPLPAFCRHRS